jgi:hypothetical protein
MEEIRNSYVVVNGVEVNDTPLLESEAADLAIKYQEAGCTEVYVVDKAA